MTQKELAEALWQEYKDERVVSKRAKKYQPCTLEQETLSTIYNLLRDYGKESEVFPYVCEEYLQTLSYRDYGFAQVVRNAVESYRTLQEKGVRIPQKNLTRLETLLKRVNKRNEYLRQVEDNAGQGIWDEKVRGNIKGFDLINDNIGIFHDSEVLDFKIDADNNVADITLHMCNGANSIVKLRFEGHLSCEIFTEGRINLYNGYFYQDRGAVVLELDGFGHIFAQHIEVVEVTELEDEGEPLPQPVTRKAPKQIKPREGANCVVLKWNRMRNSEKIYEFPEHVFASCFFLDMLFRGVASRSSTGIQSTSVFFKNSALRAPIF